MHGRFCIVFTKFLFGSAVRNFRTRLQFLSHCIISQTSPVHQGPRAVLIQEKGKFYFAVSRGPPNVQFLRTLEKTPAPLPVASTQSCKPLSEQSFCLDVDYIFYVLTCFMLNMEQQSTSVESSYLACLHEYLFLFCLQAKSTT